MPSRLKENASAIIISKFIIDNNAHALSVDIGISEYNLYILGVTVIKDDETGNFIVEMPENYCALTNRDFKTLIFGNILDWIYIRQEIEKELNRINWIQEFFKDSDNALPLKR